MKIIGKTAAGYLMEMSETEIAQAMGFGSTYAREWEAASKAARENGQSHNGLRVGSTLLVSTALEETGRILRGREDLLKAATMMRGLSALIEQGPAGLIIPPQEPKEPT